MVFPHGSNKTDVFWYVSQSVSAVHPLAHALLHMSLTLGVHAQRGLQVVVCDVIPVNRPESGRTVLILTTVSCCPAEHSTCPEFIRHRSISSFA